MKNIEYADIDLDKLMWDLHLHYENELQSKETFDPLIEFVANNKSLEVNKSANFNFSLKLAFIESNDRKEYETRSDYLPETLLDVSKQEKTILSEAGKIHRN